MWEEEVPAFTACTFSGRSEILELSVIAMCTGSILFAVYLLFICCLFVVEVEIKIALCVFVMYYRYSVNSEQCAVYQQQCCDHHGYWNW